MDQWNSAAKSVCACEITVESLRFCLTGEKSFLYSTNLQTIDLNSKFIAASNRSALTVSFNRSVMKNALLISGEAKKKATVAVGCQRGERIVEKIKIKSREND